MARGNFNETTQGDACNIGEKEPTIGETIERANVYSINIDTSEETNMLPYLPSDRRESQFSRRQGLLDYSQARSPLLVIEIV